RRRRGPLLVLDACATRRAARSHLGTTHGALQQPMRLRTAQRGDGELIAVVAFGWDAHDGIAFPTSWEAVNGGSIRRSPRRRRRRLHRRRDRTALCRRRLHDGGGST